MSQSPIELKGSSFTLSVIHLHHSQPDVIHQALQDKIDQAPDFLHNAPVVLNLTDLDGEVDWARMQQAVTATGLRIVGVSGIKDKILKQRVLQSGLPVLSEGKTSRRKQEIKASEVTPLPQPTVKTRIVHTPVRSGQQIYARDADLVVTNSVSAGAELVADGNIHIYGMMRGRALAGANGDRECQIFCTNLAAELMSIAGEYWIMDQIPADLFGKAVRLALIEGELTIQSLN